MMKKKFSFFLACLFILTSAASVAHAEDSSASDTKNLSDSPEYTQIRSLEEEMVTWIGQMIYIDQDIPEDFHPEIEYDNASKIYVDTNLEEQSFTSQDEIMSYLKSQNYVWVIPVDASLDGASFSVTVARATNQDIQIQPGGEVGQSNTSEGKWSITEVATYTTDSYKQQMETETTPIDDHVFIGGIPGLHYPIALCFADGEAKYWKDLGSSYSALEEMPQARLENTTLYNYEQVMNVLQDSQVAPYLSGQELQEKETLLSSPIIWIFAIGIALIVVIGGVLFFEKKRRSK